ncbi:MAG: hypothetical protein AMXMBFR48_29380 [Ignavibacteriales bacterium]
MVRFSLTIITTLPVTLFKSGFLLLLIVLGLQSETVAQTRADSLEEVVNSRLKEGRRDLVTADAALLAASEYMISSSPKFFAFISLTLELGTENNSQLINGQAYTILGHMYRRMGIYNLAIKSYNSALKEFTKAGNTGYNIFTLSDIGNIYYEKQMYDIAATYYRRGLEIWNGNEEKWHGGSICFINLGLVSLKLKNYDSAYSFFGRALDLRKRHGSPFFIAHGYYYFGRLFQERGEFDSALHYLNISRRLLKSYFDENTATAEINEFSFDIYSVMVDIYKDMPDEKRLEAIFLELLKNKMVTGTNAFAQRLYEQYADFLRERGNNGAALSYLDKAIEASRMLGYKPVRMKLLLKKASLYDQSGDKQGALTTYREYALLVDSVYADRVSSELVNLQEKQELERQDAEMQNLVTEKEQELLVKSVTNTILIAVSLIAVFFLYTYYRKYKLDNNILKFLRTLINSLRYPFYVVNTDSKEIEYYNYTAEEQLPSLKKVRKNGEKLFFTGNLDTILNELKNGKTFFQRQFEDEQGEGGVRHFEVSNYPVYDQLGAVIQVIEYIRDITPLKEAERRLQEYTRELEETNRSKDRLISIIAHDLKSPFSVLLGSISILRDSRDEMSYEERQKFIDNLFDAASKVYKLVENLLEWSILNAGRVSYNPMEVNMCALFSQGIQAFSLDLQNRQIAVNINCPGNLTVMADINMQRTIFRNLLANAIKFSPNNSSIEVLVKITDSEAKVCITDHGIGMSNEDIEKLFRSDIKNSEIGTPHSAKGTGLGLIIAQEFIKLNHGVVSVQSQPGSGTTVCYTVPLSAASKSN